MVNEVDRGRRLQEVVASSLRRLLQGIVSACFIRIAPVRLVLMVILWQRERP